MRTYELMFILHPELAEDDRKAIVERVNGIIEKFEGKTERFEDWGRKRLAYQIDKLTQGYYYLYQMVGSPEMVAEISRILKLSDPVLRQMTVLLDKKALDHQKKIAAQAEARARAQAEAEAREAAAEQSEEQAPSEES